MDLAVTHSLKTNNRFFVLIASIAALAGILFGYDTGVISGAILFINDEFHLTPQTNGIVVGAVLLGALLGAIISGRLTDHLGRKRLLMIDALIFIIGSLLTAIAPSIINLILGRIIVGLAIGVASYVAPLYIAEIAPVKYRGALVSLNQLAITIGILLSYIVDYICAPHAQWRWMFASGVVPALILFIGLLYLPESPRWMAAHSYFDKALKTLQRIHGAVVGQRELTDIQASLQHQRAGWKILFEPFIRSTIIIGVGLAVVQQVTGINTIIYYAPTIFKMAGFASSTTAILATMGVGVVFVLFTVIALPLIDSIGRRPLLFAGLIGMAASLYALSWAFAQSDNSALLKWVAMSSMLVYIACFAFSLGPIMWLMISEIYPLRVRGLGSSLATTANWGSNMIVALTFLTLIEYFGAHVTFLIYCAISLLSLIFIYYLVPETKGISLERIEENLHAGLSFRKMAQ
jgi:sugar porter (SP) family MFS transporter